MNLSSKKRPLILGLAMAGAAGAAAIVTLAVASPQTSQTQPAAAPAPQIPVAVTSSVSSPAVPSTTPSRPPQTAAAASAPAPLTPMQARAIAERAANGQADQVEATVVPGGLSYDVSVVRADGTDVQLVIDGRTGRVLSNVSEAEAPQEPQNTPEPQDTASSNND